MNYRHIYHAGNFADVFKHVMLTRALVYLMRKQTPLRYLDTHAGAGLYAIDGGAASRTAEWREGAGRLIGRDLPAPVRALLAPYLTAAGLDGPMARKLYPGSPVLAQRLLRPFDHLGLCELHAADARALSRALGRDRRVKAVHMDGYVALNAWIPPPERRGLVLIDPPFEAADEFRRLAAAVAAAWRKWPTGTFMAWYPRKDPGVTAGFHAELASSGLSRVLCLECDVAAATQDGPLAGSGLVIVNPPFALEAEARVILPFLCEALARGPGARWRIDWRGAA